MAIDLHNCPSPPDNQNSESNHINTGYDFKTAAAASGAVALFYLFCAFALGWIGFVLAFYIVGVAAAPYVIGGLLPAITAMQRLGHIILNSLRLVDGPNWHTRLSVDDAPKLYEMVETVAHKIGVQPPTDIFLEMSAGAAVQLLGYRTGQGQSKLYIGYDLLAVMTQSEFESVIAHELAHSKLIARAHSKWCNIGLSQACQLGDNLTALVTEHEHKKKKFHTASVMRRCSHRLASLVSGSYGTLNRHLELAADRLAAECCGSNVFGNALVLINIAEYKGKDINWRDRKVCIERGQSFNEWLRGKLSPSDDAERRRIESFVLRYRDDNEYSTHPPLSERLASLPSRIRQLVSNEPAIELLAHPDDVAASYVRRVEKIISEEERKETESLRSEVDKKVRGANTKPMYTAGQIAGIVALIIGIFASMAGVTLYFYEAAATPGLLLLGCASLGTGAAAYKKCMRRETSALVVPPYELWVDGLISDERNVPIAEWKDDAERRVLSTFSTDIRGKRVLAAHWAEVCYALLGQCDYRGAMVASEFCLAADQYRLEGLLTRSIALAWLGQTTDSYAALNKAYATNPFGCSMAWGLGWALVLNEGWADAERYLLKAVELYPKAATALGALSISQRQRGKHNEAIESARRAVASSPGCVRLRKTLINTLLAAAQPKEALSELKTLEHMGCADYDVMLEMVYAHGFCNNIDDSKLVAARTEEMYPRGKTFLDLAHAFEATDHDDSSSYYFEKAVECGFYPEALYGLSHSEFRRGNFSKAQEMLTSALDCIKTPGEGSAGPLALLQTVCSAMLTMKEESEGCRGYYATIDLTESLVAAKSMTVLISAKSTENAVEHAKWLYEAMFPGMELSATAIKWEDVPDNTQLDRPAVLGIYEVRIC